MEFDLSANYPNKAIFDGEGGSYEAWKSTDLAKLNVGGGKLLLKPGGFALPHFADSAKIGCVLQGTDGIVGIVSPNSSKEVILKLKKGDIIPVPLGGTSWWYNNGDSDFRMIFIGETSKAYIPGEFTYFFLSGGLGIIGGFSSKFTSQAFNFNENEANKLAKSQNGVLIIKLGKEICMPNPNKEYHEKFVYNIENSSADLEIQKGGNFKSLTVDKFPFIGQVGLSVNSVKLNENAMYAPNYSADGSARVFYVANGSGEVQIVGVNGKLILDVKIEEGQLFLVPKFFTVSAIAGDQGLELLCVINSLRPIIEEFASKKSVWNAISPIVSQVSLDITPYFEEKFKSNMKKSSIIIPPTK